MADEQAIIIGQQTAVIDDQSEEIEELRDDLAEARVDLNEALDDAAGEADARARAERELALYGAPDDPNLAPVSIEGRWDIAWAPEALECFAFDDESCAEQKVLRIINIAEAQTRAARVRGGPLPLDNLSYSMTGSETTSFSCNGRPMTTTHQLTFDITAADLVNGTIVPRELVGELRVTASDGTCNRGSARWSFTATRIG